MSYEGDPRRCPSCGQEVRRFDPSKCEFCGSRVTSGMDSCPNCGAPFGNVYSSSDSSVSGSKPKLYEQTIPSSAANRALRRVGCLVVLSLAFSVIGAAVFLITRAPGTTETITGRTTGMMDNGSLVMDAFQTDSIYRGTIVEDHNTVEDIWPRVIADLPDSCYYPNAYDPSAAFRFTVGDSRVLARIEASAPFDLVMTLLRDDNGVLSFAGWNEDGSPGNRDPMIVSPLDGGTYIAVVTALGGYEYGEVRFFWSVIQDDIPLVSSDTSFVVTISASSPVAYFDLDIERGRTYSIRTASRVENMDSFIELRTEGGSLLTDDDSGRSDFCWGDANLVFTASPLQEGRASVIVRPFSMSSPDYGDLEVIFTSTGP